MFHSDSLALSFSVSLMLFGHDWSMCQVWWGIMALERVCSSVMWPQQMAQLSIRVGSPAVCSPASCFTAIKYHQGSAKEGRKEQGREGGEGKAASQGGRAGLRKKEQERGQMGGRDKEKMKMRWWIKLREVCVILQTEVVQNKEVQKEHLNWMYCILSTISVS